MKGTFQNALILDSTVESGVSSVMADLNTLTDEALLERSLKEPSAFEVLVDRYQALFLERALFVLKNRDDAEDAVQDAFVRLYRFASRFSGDAGTFKAWAMTVLMNVARTRYQKRVKDWLRTAPLTPEHYESLADPNGGEALIEDAVVRLLAKAPDDVAQLLRRAYLEGKTYEEIAAEDGVSVGAIKTRVHRAKKALKLVLEEIEVYSY